MYGERIELWRLPHKFCVQLRRGHELGDGRPWSKQTVAGFTSKARHLQSFASSVMEIRDLNQPLSEALQQRQMSSILKITSANTTFHLQPGSHQKNRTKTTDIKTSSLSFTIPHLWCISHLLQLLKNHDILILKYSNATNDQWESGTPGCYLKQTGILQMQMIYY